MKLLDVSRISKYFHMAGIPYYTVQHYAGNITRINGTALNTTSGTIDTFKINLLPDDNIHFTIKDKTIVL
jgi:hypothetical protein